jgi:N-acetylmuramidase/Putative peptidoglycan binding domain
MIPQFVGNSMPLSESGLINVCSQLGTDAAAIWAVLHVETAGCGFLADRRPPILFERHIFSRETNRQFDAQGDISNPAPGGYGAGGTHQYDRLEKAMKLDQQAALRSASWGIGQIMGLNAQIAGFKDVGEMINAMVESEDRQLLAIAQFLKHNGLDAALKAHDWTRFARGYNGPNFAANQYDKKLEAAFAQNNVLLPYLNVRTAQMFLMYLGFTPGAIDGAMGPRTRSALELFQQNEGLPVNGNVDAATVDRLRAKVG